MDEQQRQLIKKYLDILLRRHKIIISSLLVGVIGGLSVYLGTPQAYRCFSLIQYQQQGINPTAMSPDNIKTKTQDIVNTVSQQVLSRTSLESAIKELKLYPTMLQKLPMEDVVEHMRKQIIIKPTDKNGEVHRLTFTGDNPRKTLQTTNTLASKFIEENLRFRQEKVSETSNYIEDELKIAQTSLDKKETVMRDFKLKYYNEMPEQSGINMTRLNALQERYQQSVESSHDAERTALLIQEQISLREQLLANMSNQPGNNPVSIGLQDTGSNDARQTYLKLQQLKTRYTDSHPEIKRLNKELESLGGWHESDSAHISTELPNKPNKGGSTGLIDPQIIQLKHQIKDIQDNLVRSKEERGKMQEEIKKLQGWISAVPVREAEWSALTRDYQQLQEHYQLLVKQDLQAESAQTLENRLQGSQFKIIDPAHFPAKPFKPNMKKIMLFAIAVGLGLGGVLAFSLELLGTSFKSTHDLESAFGLPVVSVVPLIRTKKEEKNVKVQNILWGGLFFSISVGILAAAFYLWRNGRIIL